MKEKVDVLFIDDDPDICIMVSSLLAFGGYSMKHTSDYDEFLKMIPLYDPKVILMDMLLSGMNGKDICKKLKSEEATKHIKVIMMSAHPDADKSCREAGADDFISKPFDMDYFLEKIKSIVSQ